MTTKRQRLSAEELAAIRQRAEKATPGPWTVSRLARGYVLVDSEQYTPIATTVEYNEDGTVHMLFAGDECDANQQFIAHAREDIPRLLDALEAAYAEIERLQIENTALRQLEREYAELVTVLEVICSVIINRREKESDAE